MDYGKDNEAGFCELVIKGFASGEIDLLTENGI